MHAFFLIYIRGMCLYFRKEKFMWCVDHNTFSSRVDTVMFSSTHFFSCAHLIKLRVSRSLTPCFFPSLCWLVLFQHAVAFVKDEESPEAAARKLTDIAFRRGSTDNITCIVVEFCHDKMVDGSLPSTNSTNQNWLRHSFLIIPDLLSWFYYICSFLIPPCWFCLFRLLQLISFFAQWIKYAVWMLRHCFVHTGPWAPMLILLRLRSWFILLHFRSLLLWRNFLFDLL